MIFRIAALAVLLTCSSAAADPIDITSTPVSSFRLLAATKQFGALTWRGGLSLASGNSRFGGLSGLSLNSTCDALVAVSDAGRWFTARLAYDANGDLVSATGGSLAPILDGKGQPPRTKNDADAEALSALGNGQYLVGFESRPRVGIYDFGKNGSAARFQLVKSPKAIAGGPFNGEMEALGRLTGGPFAGFNIAISERHRDRSGNLRGWLWKGAKTLSFTIQPFENFQVTDLAVLPGGDVLILERNISQLRLPGMTIRRFPTAGLQSGSVLKPALVFEGRFPFYAIDNMEGMSLCRRDGETRLTLVSDNNFNNNLQRTLLLQFAFAP